LRLSHPRLGRIPDASLSLIGSLGLTAFLAAVGIGAAPDIKASFTNFGWFMLASGAIVAVVPHVVTILIGRHVTHTHPGVLLGICAGAGTSAPALEELEKLAHSKIPALGYGLACAIGNVLFAICGTVLVLFGQH